MAMPESPRYDKWTADVRGTPDFRQIARDVFMADDYGDSPIAAIEEQLRQVWNARGAADCAKIDALDVLEHGAAYARLVNHAIRSLDR